ncbi:S8 family serine peptidase [bacterium]|nr:S8 family serine peptidase [bacterium]
MVRSIPSLIIIAVLVPLLLAGCGGDRVAGPEDVAVVPAGSGDDGPGPRRKPVRKWGYVAPDVPIVRDAPAVPGQAIIHFEPTDDVEHFNINWGTTTIRHIEGSNATLVATPPGVSVVDLVTEMITYGDCMWAEPNYVSETPEGAQGTIPFYEGDHVFGDVADQGAMARIGAPQAHLTATGNGVLVAIVDTGIDGTHPDLAASVSSIGWDFVDDDPLALDERNELDDDGDGLVDEGAGHGTHVAGLVLAAAPNVTLMPVRVLDSEGSGTSVGVARGIRWAADNGADVINLSLGMYVDARVIRDAIEDAVAHGTIVVNSAGNRGMQAQDHFPARLSRVLSVAATDSVDARAIFSNFSSHVDVSAPGVGMLSTFLDHGYAVWSGTSMAAPLVSGCVALRLEQYPWATQDDMEDIFKDTCAPIANDEGTIWDGKMGDGRIDAAALVAF